MIKIEIDGKEISAEEGSSIIENADRFAIPIPRFCYHKKLSVAANCRMCLVQVEKSNKPMPACATPVAEGMKIWTKSKEAIAAQRSVMEFLLINHPLDCPICDQGGECELQDVSMDYGQDFSRYDEPKRAVYDQNLGPLISTDMTRCIHCTRCVRFGDEISGEREIGATGRGEKMEIGTFIEQNVNSEVSGNIIDLCPVGALTSKPFRFRARSWELTEYPGIALHDCLGANTYLHVHHKAVIRVAPRENDAINEIWLSDRDRFSYEGFLHEDRLRKPMVRKHDKWQVVSWVESLKYTIAGLQLVLEKYSAEKIGVLASPSVSTEEYYLLQKFVRGLGINNIDHRLRQLDFRDQDTDPIYPGLGIEYRDLENQDTLLMIGSYLSKELPNAALKVRKMTLKGGKVSVVNPVDYDFNFPLESKQITADLVKDCTDILQALKSDPTKSKIANSLQNGKKKLVILGQLALMHPEVAKLKELGREIADQIDGEFGYFSLGSNAAGASLAGCLPHRLPGGLPAPHPGMHALDMINNKLNCYILYAIEPGFDSILGAKALAAISEADFVVAISSYQSEELLKIADVILPIALFTEASGTYINIDGVRQQSRATTQPFGEARPGWKVLRVLANMAEVEGFEYNSVDEVLAEINEISITDKIPQVKKSIPNKELKGIQRFAPISLYAIDGIVRRSMPLQQTNDAIQDPKVQMHPNTAKEYAIVDGDKVKISAAEYNIELLLELDDRVAMGAVIIYQANSATNMLPADINTVEVKKC